MKTKTFETPLRTALAAAVLTLSTVSLKAQLDETWTVKVRGETVQVGPNGLFFVPNISAADRFGEGGPGTPRDGRSDDFFLARAVSEAGGTTRYAYSEPFQIRNGKTFRAPRFAIGSSPPPIPSALSIDAESPVALVGETLQLTVTATLPDGSTAEATTRAEFTVYRSSNPRIARVDRDGIFRGLSPGPVFITASNFGATAVKRFTVSSETQSVTVEGFVQLADGTPAAGVTVTSLFGAAVTTDADGFFTITLEVPTSASAVISFETLVDGEKFTASVTLADFLPDGIADVGTVVLLPAAGFVFGNPLFLTGEDASGAVTADFNEDGRLDMVVVKGGNCDDCGIDGIAILLGGEEGLFQPPILTEAGTGPIAVDTADIDGDGDLDLAVANYFDMTVSLMIGDGTGNFTEETIIPVHELLEVQGLALADLDGENGPDIVVYMENGFERLDLVKVYLNQGNGVFGEQVRYEAGFRPRGLGIGDLDKSGTLDLVLATFEGVAVLLGNGDGTFADYIPYQVNLIGRSLALTDLDGDGWLDVAFGTPGPQGGTDQVAVLLNDQTGVLGGPTFFTVGNDPNWMDSGDFDQNGDVDLVVANWFDGTASVLSGDGNGGFAEQIVYPTAASRRDAHFVLARDLDQDGDLDLAVAADDYVSVLFGEGDGSFSHHPKYILPASLKSPRLDDIDGDGDLDLIVLEFGGSTVWTLRNDGEGAFDEQTSQAVGISANDVTSGQLRGDASVDLAAAGSGSLVILEGDGAGSFVSADTIALGDFPIAVESGDLDGDLDLDLMVLIQKQIKPDVVMVLFNNGGSFDDTLTRAVPNGPGSGGIGHFNNDGLVDLLVVSTGQRIVSVLFGDDENPFTSNQTHDASGRLEVARDLDGDGPLDIVLARGFTTSLSVLLGIGDGTFTSAPAPTFSSTAAGSLDADGDGDIDLLVGSSRPSGSLVLTENVGGGAFESRELYGPGGQDIVTGDLDGDGDEDVVTILGSEISVLLNRGQ